MNAVDAAEREIVTPRARARAIPRLALTPAEAAYSIGVSEDFFGVHIRPELRCVRRGAKVLFPVGELERWLDEQAARTL